MKARRLHSWSLAPRTAIALQKELRKLLLAEPIRPWPRWVAGADCAYGRRSNLVFAAVALMRLPELTPVAVATAVRKATYPYVPGLLTFREAPALLKAFSKLRRAPEAVLFDGQGRAHPRGIGLAAHVGLILDLPTVGCAKSLLVGSAEKPGPRRGDRAPLRINGRIAGAVLRTADGVNPIYVSAGHRCTLRDAVRLTLACCAGYRIPEPTRRAHNIVTLMRAAAER